MRKKLIRFPVQAAAQALQVLQDKAAGPYPKQPTHIGEAFVRLGVTTDINTTLRDANGEPIGWVKHERDLAHVVDDSDPENPEQTGEYEIDLYALSEPSTDEIPDPAERAVETARVNANLARLTVQERATVAQALAQGGGGGQPNLAGRTR